VPADLEPLELRAAGGHGAREVEWRLFLKAGDGITGRRSHHDACVILRESGIPSQVAPYRTPVTAMIDTSRDQQWNVLELSSFSSNHLPFQSSHAIALNVTSGSLDQPTSNSMRRQAVVETQQSADFAS